MNVIKGIPVSSGCVIGNVSILNKEEPLVKMVKIEKGKCQEEIRKLHDAISLAKEQIEALYVETSTKLGKDTGNIFSAHIDILSDPVLLHNIESKVLNEHKSISWAVDESIQEFYVQFQAIEDDYFKERGADIKDIGERLLKILQNRRSTISNGIDNKTIMAAYDLLPSDVISINSDIILGIITENGSRTAHASIIARGMGIPMVVGVHNLMSIIKENDLVVIDGTNGTIYINPTNELLTEYERKVKTHAYEKNMLAKIKCLPAKTTDGKVVSLYANIGNENDAKQAFINGAEGIGLYRTELLYMNSKQFPTEKEQFDTYKAVCEQARDRVITFRTLDIGGDKSLPYFDFPHEDNPSLGWRAIRVHLDYEHLLITQLKAMLAVSGLHKVRIMFPMIISIEELRKIKDYVKECKRMLLAEGIPFDDNVKLGIMVETPSAVLLAEKFAKEADFLSIGTNDLTQYILAVDRGNEKISHLYNPFHPSVLMAIKHVIDVAKAEGKPLSICGELAGDENATLLLLGMGLDEFSMNSTSIGKIKNIIINSSYEKAKEMAIEVLSKGTVDEVLEIVKAYNSCCNRYIK